MSENVNVVVRVEGVNGDVEIRKLASGVIVRRGGKTVKAVATQAGVERFEQEWKLNQKRWEKEETYEKSNRKEITMLYKSRKRR